jgi:argininosuccinate lyase
MAGTTHWQPAQPVLLAFWLAAAAEPFARNAQHFRDAASDALEWCPLGSAALAGSSLPLDRLAAAKTLGFRAPSRNAMDAIGNRDAALHTAHAFVRAVLSASRICEELILWCTPAFGYARLGDAASTGSSLMPQKRNPDPFELVRGTSATLIGQYAGALASVSGLALSYHRDLQVTKAAVVSIVERAVAALDAFARALPHVQFNHGRMTAMAGEGYTVATDVADALIAGGLTARAAHAQVGEAIRTAEESGQPPEWPDASASVQGKVTPGSTNPSAVDAALTSLEADLAELQA